MLREGVSWWAARMRELAPARWRRTAAGPANALVFTLHDLGAVSVNERRRGRETEKLRFDLTDAGVAPAMRLLRQRRRDLPVVLRPPPSGLLERDVALPLAAAPDLARVLDYEMDRFTPFRAADVFWAYEVQSRDKAAGVLRIRLSVIPRAGLVALSGALEREGAPPTLLECPVAGGVRVIPIERALTAGQRGRRRALMAGVLGCAALALAAIALPLIRQSLALGAVGDRIAELRPRVAAVEALRRKIAGAADGADTIARESLRLGDPLRVLATITSILPDDTWLTSFGLHDRVLTLEGQSAAAAKLIPLLAAAPSIREPAFTAPVTRTDHGADLFALRARIVP